jgi:tetratricopeptide (TPR) repeat protein
MVRFWWILFFALTLLLPFRHHPRLLSAIYSNIAAVYSLGSVDSRQVEEWFTRSYNINSENVPACINEGRWLLGQDQESKAIRKLERAVSLKPDSVAARFFLGLSLTESGRIDYALVQFQKIGLEKIENESFNILKRFAWRHLQSARKSTSESREWIKAERYYLILRALFPDSWTPWMELVDFYFEWDRDSAKGLSVLKEAEGKFPRNPSPNLELADYFILVGSYDQALGELEKVFEKEPGNIRLYATLCRLLNDQIHPSVEEWYLRAAHNVEETNRDLRCLRVLNKRYQSGMVLK